jgi:hypothetical protein
MISCVLLALALGAEPAEAQFREVVVGVTTTCPYENAIEGSCWSGAYFALMKLEGVKAVDESANGYTCTARVYLKEMALPEPEKWAKQFKENVGQTYIFRGVEATVTGSVESHDSGPVLRVSGLDQPIALRPFEHKLQWNARKGAARQPEPDERVAYQQLATRVKDATEKGLKVVVTGPLTRTESGYDIEIREFFPVTQVAEADPEG